MSRGASARTRRPERGGGLTWSGSAWRGGTWPCCRLSPWRRSGTTSACCSASCCDGGGLLCCGSPPSSCRTGASGALAMPRGSGGASAPDWSGGDVWRSGHLLSCSSGSRRQAKEARNTAQKCCLEGKQAAFGSLPTSSGGESSSLCGCGSGPSRCSARASDPSGPTSSLTSSPPPRLCSRHSQPRQPRQPPVPSGSCWWRCGAYALSAGWPGRRRSWRPTDGASAEEQGPTEDKEEEGRRRRNRPLEVFQAVEAVLRCTCQKKVNISKKKI